MRKKSKSLLILIAVLAIAVTCALALVACGGKKNEHKCEDKCPECGQCLTDCEDDNCAEKCPGNHNSQDEHTCESKCEEPECGLCKNPDCTEDACKDKCPGHGTVGGEHECESKCEEPECGLCKNPDCTEDACKDKCPGHEVVEDEYTIIFETTNGDITGTLDGAATATTVNGKLTSLPDVTPNGEHVTFLGWYTAAEGGEKVDTDYVFEGEETEITIYAHYQQEYVITLNAGEGTLPAGAKTEFVTVDGKLPEKLSKATITKAHWSFMDWYDGETAVDMDTIFVKDTELTAKYGRDSGVWSGEDADVFKIALVKNTGASGVIAEYWFGGASTKISVTEGERLALYLDGKLISHYVTAPVGVEGNKGSSSKSDYVTVTVTGELNLYLKHYSHATDKENYVCEWLGATKVETGSEVPAGCDPVKITFSGNVVVTIYLVDNTGTSVGQADFSKFCIYTYNGEAFGNWATSATKGVLASEMTATIAVPSGWIFRWGSGYGQQTANIVDVIQGGKTYLVTLGTHQGTAKVTELNLA